MRIAMTYESNKFTDLERAAAAVLNLKDRAEALGLIVTNVDIDPHG